MGSIILSDRLILIILINYGGINLVITEGR
nr:MAG TPA: hypothetical protein [Bacteriophage sp.]